MPITEKKVKTRNIKFLIVEKNGDIKESEIKEDMICAEELAKKCKFKKTDGYVKRTEWGYAFKSDNGESCKIVVEMWGKDDGMANHENKYEFPPPLDHDLYFGACVLIARDYKNNYTDLTEDMWDDIYEYLFGGFESLAANEDEDDDEYDELDSIPMNRKTRDGYLKDGFVVDSNRITDRIGDEDSCGNSGEDDDDEDSETDDSSEDDNDDDICEESEEDSDDGGVKCYNKKVNKANKANIGNISNNKNTIIDKNKNKDKIPLIDVRLSMSADTKHKNIKEKENDKYKEKDNKEKDNKDNKYKTKDKNKDKNKEKDDDCDNGWKTDESSELSEEEYSYSK
jgi:hypothetical protein